MRKLYSIFVSRCGFTLIELTIVLGVFLVIGTIILSILSSTFQGNTRTQVTNEISQNGNYALSIITNLLNNTQRFETIQASCGTTDLSTCCNPTGVNGKSITVRGLDGGVTTLACDDTGANPTYRISSNSASLIDTSKVMLVADSCSFTCTQRDEYSPPRIDIEFTIRDTAGSNTSAIFRTSVSLRNQNL